MSVYKEGCRIKKASLLQRTNGEWVEALSDPVSSDALTDLRDILLRGLRASLSSQITTDLDSITEDFVQEALLDICKNIYAFRGESRFTTWAMKTAIHIAFIELGCRRQDTPSNFSRIDFTLVPK